MVLSKLEKVKEMLQKLHPMMTKISDVRFVISKAIKKLDYEYI